MQKGIYSQELKTVCNAVIQIGDIDDTGKGRHFVSKFIQDGLVKIEGHGIVLLKKETIDQSLQSMVGAPVIIKHQDITNENADDLRCGVISKAYFNDLDGWYYCEGIIWDEKAKELVNNGWSVSCSYDFLAYNDEGGVENNIKYDKEFTQLNFTHLALVNNPRYERANIIFNSKVDNFSEENINRKPAGTPEGGQFAPIKGYHGSNVDFETFDSEKDWHFLSSNYTIAKSYMKPKQGFIYETEINLKNPYTFDAKGNSWADLDKQGLRTNDIARKAKSEGFDGVIIKDVKDIGREFPYHSWTEEEIKTLDIPHTDYIVFDPENIKINKKNIINWVDNSKEQEMKILDELKKLISKVENEKGEQDMDEKEKVDNETVDKRKLIDEVAGIMKSAGCDDEDIRTAIGKMEKIGYDKSEAGSADNKKVKNEEPDKKEDVDNEKDEEEKKDDKIDNEDEEDKKEVKEVKEEVKEDVDNKCKNSKSSFDKINEIYNSVKQVAQESTYVTRQEKLDNAVEYFK